MHVQLLEPATRDSGFVLGGTPVVPFTDDRLRVGLGKDFGLFDGDHVFMPISTRLAVYFTTRPEQPQLLTPLEVKEMNSLSSRASRFVIMDPRLDPGRMLPYRVTVETSG